MKIGTTLCVLLALTFACGHTSTPTAKSTAKKPTSNTVAMGEQDRVLIRHMIQEERVARQVAAEAKAKEEAARAQEAARLAQVAPPPYVAPPATTGPVPDMIVKAFSPLGAGAVAWGLRIAKCESGYNPAAHNPSGASGVFQFMPGTWAGTPQGKAGMSVWDAWANVQAGAWLYATSGPGPWSCK